MTFEIFICVPLIILFFLFGILFLHGKGDFFLAGWNTMSEKKRAKYNKKALFKFTGLMCFALAAVLMLMLLGIHLYTERNNSILLTISTVLLFVIPITSALYVNIGKRFRAEGEKND